LAAPERVAAAAASGTMASATTAFDPEAFVDRLQW
jgi:hypothetical protein